jgi:hypothetical protein
VLEANTALHHGGDAAAPEPGSPPTRSAATGQSQHRLGIDTAPARSTAAATAPPATVIHGSA